MFEYPENFVIVMRSQVNSLKRTIGFHFKNRHINGKKPVRNWIREYRRVVRSSGYDIALQQVENKK